MIIDVRLKHLFFYLFNFESIALKFVKVPPRFIKQPTPILNVSLKSDAELECTAYGVPSPTIQWFKNGEPIYPSEYFQLGPNQGSLKILGIIAQDEGYYQCLASNELNTIQAVAQLVVQLEDSDYQQNGLDSSDYYDADTPKAGKKVKTSSKLTPVFASTSLPIVHLSAPIKLRISRTKSRSLVAEWQPPPIMRDDMVQDEDGLGLIYSVTWGAKHDKQRQREMNTTNNTLLIDELIPETIYLIQVCAIVGLTRSPYVFLEAKTEPERVLAGKPLDFRAEFIDLTNQNEDESVSTSSLVDSNRVLRVKKT